MSKKKLPLPEALETIPNLYVLCLSCGKIAKRVLPSADGKWRCKFCTGTNTKPVVLLFSDKVEED